VSLIVSLAENKSEAQQAVDFSTSKFEPTASTNQHAGQHVYSGGERGGVICPLVDEHGTKVCQYN